MSLRLSDTTGPIVNICGIDPGTNHLGFAKLGIEVATGEIVSVWAATVRVDKLPMLPAFIEGAHTERMEKLLKIKESVKQSLAYWKPRHLSCESPFYNRLRPSAYGPLVESVMAVKLAAYEHSAGMRFDTLEPSVIKKAIGAGGGAGKEPVKQAVLKNEALQAGAEVELESLDEHAIDAIAVAYSYWKLFLKEGVT